MTYSRMSSYPKGSKVQHRSRYIFIKQDNRAWKAEHRWIMEQKRLGRDLEPGERVFHLNGVKDANHIENLVVIKFSMTKFVPLKKSVVLFIPGVYSMKDIRKKARRLQKAA